MALWRRAGNHSLEFFTDNGDVDITEDMRSIAMSTPAHRDCVSAPREAKHSQCAGTAAPHSWTYRKNWEVFDRLLLPYYLCCAVGVRKRQATADLLRSSLK